MATLGTRIKSLREKNNYTQKQVANSISVSNVQLSRYESDTRQPDYETLEKLADFFNVSTDYLLGRDAAVLTEEDEKDIARELERMLSDLDSKNSLAFNGEPMDERTRQLVKQQLELNLRFATEMSKKQKHEE